MLLIFGILVGLALGLTGGGGSLVAVPLLVYVLGMPPQASATLSMAVVTVTALGGALAAWRSRLLVVPAALSFTLGGVVGAPFGVNMAEQISEEGLMFSFACLMLVVAGLMLWRSYINPPEASVVRAGFDLDHDERGAVCRYQSDGQLRITAPCSVALASGGLVAGLLAGLFGVGGGFLIVPALVFITQMDIHRAVATSLLVIAAIGSIALLTSIGIGRELDWVAAAWFSAGGVVGMALGRLFAGRLAGPWLQRVFALGAGTLAVNLLVSI